MATGPKTPFRLVRCPKCRQLLPELPNVPLYRCGGCGALLRAKNRKTEGNRRESGQQETHAELMNEAKASPDCPDDCNKAEEHQDGHGDCKEEEPRAIDCDTEGPRVDSDLYSSTELDLVHNKTKESLSSAGAPTSAVPPGCENVGSVRSRGSHAYDGGISSYDGHEDQFSMKTRDQLRDPATNLRRLERSGLPPRAPLRQAGSGSGSGSFSGREEKMKLLKVIDQLQEKLETCYNHKEQSWHDLENPMNYHQERKYDCSASLCHIKGCNHQSSFQSRPRPSTPEDSVLFQRTYCKLRCGACSSILKFSVENRTRIIPYHGHSSYSGDASSLDSMEKRRGFTKDPVGPKSRSPLHRLMGYSSPSLVITGTGTSQPPNITTHDI